MMRRAQTIKFVSKVDSRFPHQRILYVGGVNPDGSRWRQTQQQTIKEIEDGAWLFFCQGEWRKDRIVIAEYYGHKYIKAEIDGVTPDTLLALPEFP